MKKFFVLFFYIYFALFAKSVYSANGMNLPTLPKKNNTETKQPIAKQPPEKTNDTTIKATTEKFVGGLVKVADEAANGLEKTVETDKNTEIKKNDNFSPYEDDYYKVFNTFMFTPSNFSLLKKSIAIYYKNRTAIESKRKTVIEVNEETGEKEEIEYDKNIGNVYLKSIMYISDNFWTVWINDKKISNSNNNDPDNEFFITKLDRNSAEIRWTVGKSKWNIINYENNIHISEYKFNDKTNKIEFEMFLHPNQTFVASKNEVIDGKFKENKEEEIINTITDENLDFMFNDGDIDLNLLIK